MGTGLIYTHYTFTEFRTNYFNITRTKTSIRYAKENDREKTEKRRERERKGEGEI